MKLNLLSLRDHIEKRLILSLKIGTQKAIVLNRYIRWMAF